ncbi:hypothetical protein L1787_08710 [Acuticoccus sp. M5D2P5]|uniref:hypothetical protein n=1 Tax=Acuticoccus kalidii TaxID=2910977 RepID=UPI001F1AA9CC|nr:hypothetical protein [Acuticoccus kalidii]MCF3933490.1 hypothetical protein [Acuticoccus kalidii]
MVDIYKPSSDDHLSLDELSLYRLMMDYRAENGLPAIPLSKGLTTVAGRHALDTVENERGYVGHNWSDAPYDSADPDTYPNMWEAPQRLGTNYPGYGFEISTGYLGNAIFNYDATPEGSLANWQGSPGHNAVILNEGVWDEPWLAIGVGMKNGVAHVWFGREEDRSVPQIIGTRDRDKIVATRFDDNIKAMRGDDVVKGLGGDDTLRGMAGDDKLNGGGGDDLLVGNAGDDVMIGGAGADRFLFTNRSGNDVIRGFRDNDIMDLKRTSVDSFDDLEISRSGKNTVIEFADTTITLFKVHPSEIDASDFLF